MADLSPIVIHLCNTWVERSTALQLRGKRRDDQCLDYFVGAAMALDAVGKTEEAAFVNAFAAFGVAFRGHHEVVRVLVNNFTKDT